MDKMLSYAKLQKNKKKQKLDYWTENLKIMNPIFFNQMVLNMYFWVFTAKPWNSLHLVL